MKKTLLLAAAALIVASGSMQAKSFKRGFSVNSLQKSEYELLAEGATWFYNWATVPSVSNTGRWENSGLEFIPMTWTSNWGEDQLENFLKEHPETKYLLGYNEPNFTDQAHLTPAQAAEDWPRVVAIAQKYGLKLVSPAVNWSSWAQYNDPITWLDEFFSLLPDKGESIDYIACHFYMPGAEAVKGNIDRLTKYGKPIWLTEFCAATGEISNSTQTQADYMTETIQMLEQHPDVYRYAWFMAYTTNKNWNAINLISSKTIGELSDLGVIFVNMPTFDKSVWQPVGEMIAASEYVDQSGVSLQPTTDKTDTNFALDVIDFGGSTKTDKIIYQFHVPAAGKYTLHLRLAASSNTKLDLYANDDLVLNSQVLKATGGKGLWDDDYVDIELPAGDVSLKFVASRSMQLHALGLFEASAASQLEAEKAFYVQGNSIVAKEDVKVVDLTGCTHPATDLAPGVYIVSGSWGARKIVIK